MCTQKFVNTCFCFFLNFRIKFDLTFCRFSFFCKTRFCSFKYKVDDVTDFFHVCFVHTKCSKSWSTDTDSRCPPCTVFVVRKCICVCCYAALEKCCFCLFSCKSVNCHVTEHKVVVSSACLERNAV